MPRGKATTGGKKGRPARVQPEPVVVPIREEIRFYWNGHLVVKQGEVKMVGGTKHFSCMCDDGCTYDVPAEIFES